MPNKTIQIVQVQSDGSSFIDMPDDDANPCSACGACCSRFRVSFYFGETDDHPGGRVPASLTRSAGGFRACMAGTERGGRCDALRGEVGVGPISCAIYAERPSVCREFPAWLADGTPSPDCQSLRASRGLAPLPALPAEGAAHG